MPEATSTEVTPPATGVIMQPGYAKTIGRMAYVWGWPLVNMINRSASITTGAAARTPEWRAPGRTARPCRHAQQLH